MWDQRLLCRVLHFLSEPVQPSPTLLHTHIHFADTLRGISIFWYRYQSPNPTCVASEQDFTSQNFPLVSFPTLSYPSTPSVPTEPSYSKLLYTLIPSSKSPSLLIRLSSYPFSHELPQTATWLIPRTIQSRFVNQPFPQSRHPALRTLVTAALLRLTHHGQPIRDPFCTHAQIRRKTEGKVDSACTGAAAMRRDAMRCDATLNHRAAHRGSRLDVWHQNTRANGIDISSSQRRDIAHQWHPCTCLVREALLCISYATETPALRL